MLHLNSSSTFLYLTVHLQEKMLRANNATILRSRIKIDVNSISLRRRLFLRSTGECIYIIKFLRFVGSELRLHSPRLDRERINWQTRDLGNWEVLLLDRRESRILEGPATYNSPRERGTTGIMCWRSRTEINEGDSTLDYENKLHFSGCIYSQLLRYRTVYITVLRNS